MIGVRRFQVTWNVRETGSKPKNSENSLTTENKLALNTILGLTGVVEDENVIGFSLH